jgi:hypothetical protein
MYESPINIIVNDMQQSFNEDIDNGIMVTIKQTYGIGVDKNELIKALQYDRQQYEKGRADFKTDVQNLIKEYICRYILIGAFEREKNILEEIVDRINDLS